MPRMTEEEAQYWSDYYIKNPPTPGPNGTGFFSQRRKAALSVTVDTFTADYLITKAIADHKTPADVISDMVEERLAAAL